MPTYFHQNLQAQLHYNIIQDYYIMEQYMYILCGHYVVNFTQKDMLTRTAYWFPFGGLSPHKFAYPTSKAPELLKLYFCLVAIYLNNAVNTLDYTVPNDWQQNNELEGCGSGCVLDWGTIPSFA